MNIQGHLPALANGALNTFAGLLEQESIAYERTETMIQTGLRGEDLPIVVNIQTNVTACLLQLFCPQDLTIPKELLPQAALALCRINDTLIDGHFALDVDAGTICFRLSLSYYEAMISQETCARCFFFATGVVDYFNKKLQLFSKGLLSLEELCQMN